MVLRSSEAIPVYFADAPIERVRLAIGDVFEDNRALEPRLSAIPIVEWDRLGIWLVRGLPIGPQIVASVPQGGVVLWIVAVGEGEAHGRE